MTDLHEAYRQLVEVLEEMKLPFAIGGSIASATFGVAPATQRPLTVTGTATKPRCQEAHTRIRLIHPMSGGLTLRRARWSGSEAADNPFAQADKQTYQHGTQCSTQCFRGNAVPINAG